MTSDQAKTEIEQVVAGEADLSASGILRLTRAQCQALEVCIDLGLAAVNGRGPAAQLGLDAFERKVRPFDDAHADRTAATADTLLRPLEHSRLKAVCVRQISLQDEPGAELQELALAQDSLERSHRQRQIAIRFHVQRDELRFLVRTGVGERGSINNGQTFGNSSHGLLERERLQLAEDGRNLHADRVYLRRFQQLDVARNPKRSLGL